MDFIENIQGLAARIEKQLGHLKTEEATKNALVRPFINALGYNLFDPTEVVPHQKDAGAKRQIGDLLCSLGITCRFSRLLRG